MVHGDGQEAIVVDQRQDTEQWNLLGLITYPAGFTATVTISAAEASGTEVAADAIRFEWVGAD